MGDTIRSWKAYDCQPYQSRGGDNRFTLGADYFDRFVRDEADLQRTISYVENNPVSAGLCPNRDHWRFSSAWEKKRA